MNFRATIIRMISENLENELNAAIIKDFCTKNAFADYDAVNLEAMAHETIVHTVMNCRTTATQEYKVTDKVVQVLVQKTSGSISIYFHRMPAKAVRCL